jgi:hypothetical protein
MNDYCLEWMVRQRIAELRATADRLASGRSRRLWGGVLGSVLRALGRRMIGWARPASTEALPRLARPTA